MTNTIDTLGKLCTASRKQYMNPYTAFNWPEVIDAADWCMSPELISIAGTEQFNQLSEEQKRRLSLHEIVNFFSLTIHGEQIFIEKLVGYLYLKAFKDFTAYMHHFLDEENKHMVYFAEFCLRYGGKVYPDRHVRGPGRFSEGEEEFRFFASVLIFEDIGNYYNVAMSQDARLNAMVQQINLYHHREEARHLVFGRTIVKDLFERYASKWSNDTLGQVRQYLSGCITATWAEYFNPDVYSDAGFPDPYELRETAMLTAATQERFNSATGSVVRFLTESGILMPSSGA